jgi:thiosulfate/3-mercaptopyruvate sulfurtransferase
MTEPAAPLVDATWLRAKCEAPDIRILEATWFPPWGPDAGHAHAAYQSGHIPGASFFDIDRIAAHDTDLPHMLPDTVQFASQVRKLGIGDGHRIVIYDRNRFCASARAWWMFRAMGHGDVHVLDGGLAAWQADGGGLEDLPPIRADRHFTPRLHSDRIRTVRQMEQIVDAGTHEILDARPPDRFRGDAPEPRDDLPSGHIPGSRNVPASALIDAEGRMKPPDQLASILSPGSRAIITSCGSGVTASILALGLAIIGRDEVAVFDGSWSEWASDGTRPIATGEDA